MQKNTLLFASFLAVIASLLVGFNIGRSMPSSQTLVPTPKPIATPMPTLTYLSGTACGVTYQYPNTLTPMESSGSGVILTSQTTPSDAVVIVCQADIPRVPLAPNFMETIIINAATKTSTISATLYHDTSANDGTKVDKLIFTHPKTNMDVFIAGFGPVYQQLISTLTLN